MSEGYQKQRTGFKRLAVVETIISELRVNGGRRLTDLEGLLLYYFAGHCGDGLPDAWQVTEDRLAGIYGKSTADHIQGSPHSPL